MNQVKSKARSVEPKSKEIQGNGQEVQLAHHRTFSGKWWNMRRKKYQNNIHDRRYEK